MKIEDAMQVLGKAYPNEAALDWDNVGLLVGSPAWNLSKIYVALDATEEVVEHAASFGAELIVTHHPMIFSSMKRVTDEDFIGKKIMMLAQHHIACYAMHTNFDILTMGMLSAQYLKLTDVTALDEENIGAIGTLPQKMTLLACASYVKKCFGLSHVSVFGDGDKLDCARIAICPGSGKSEIDTAIEKKADVLITGDIDHHSGIDAVQKQLPIIDAGHYGIEHIYIDYMTEFLKKQLPGIEICREPFKEPRWVL